LYYFSICGLFNYGFYESICVLQINFFNKTNILKKVEFSKLKMLLICFYRKAGLPSAIFGWYLGLAPDLDDLGFGQTKKGAPAFETPPFIVK